MAALDLTESNINEFGRFDDLKNSVDKARAKTFFEQKNKMCSSPSSRSCKPKASPFSAPTALTASSVPELTAILTQFSRCITIKGSHLSRRSPWKME